MISAITNIINGLAPTTPVEPIGPGLGMPSPTLPSPSADATSFGDMLSQVAHDTVSTLKAGEAAAITGIQGQTSVQHVVEAVMNAQSTLQTAIAVRDKVVSAYQDVSRMAI
jgi:flagellar hook-basal body complex protein FliE